MQLLAMLIQKSLEEIERRGVKSMPRLCEIEQSNHRVWLVELGDWIVFLDTKSGEPKAYHALPLSVWNA